MTNWDFEYDVIVVGSGASGFAAAITAKNEGMKTLLIEKEKVFGGASALSGGGVWVPNNRYLQEAGVADSYEEAKTYLDSTVGDRVSDEMKETYLKRGIEMLDYLHGASKHLRYSYANNYSDYYPHRDGGKGQGRSIEPLIFDLNELKDWKMIMRPSAMDTKGFVMNGQDFHKVNMITRTWAGKFRSLTLGWRLIQHKIFKKELAALGQALIGRLALAYKEIDGELLVNSAFKDFIYENDRVIGITIEKHGKPFTIKANRGVILGSGGFSRNQQFRERFLPAPTKMEWSSSPEGQTGDIITPAEKLG
ncbi:MAG: FAD-dependent oxidoreductase, partial [Kurthia sp.]